MPWPSIDPGKLRHRITIQSYGPVSPAAMDAGGPVMDWSTFTTAYAFIDPTAAEDIIRSGQIVSQQEIPITIRWQPGITSSMRVVSDDTSSTFVIKGIINHEDRNVLLTLLCLGIGSNQ